MTNILFICRHNRFRSKVAEAYFKKVNKSPKLFAKSAGTIKGSYPLDKNQVRIAKELGVNMKGKPQGLSTDLLRWSDLQIIVADDVPKILLNNSERFGKKLIVWKIPDAHHTDKKGIRKSITMIKSKIDEFIKTFN